jgi:hypothetical protein
MINRPYQLINRYIDFTTPSTVVEDNIIANGSDTPTRQYGVDYILTTINNVNTFQRIKTNGEVNNTQAFTATGSFMTGTWETTVKRFFTGIGKQVDTIKFYTRTPTRDDFDPDYVFIEAALFDYVILQKAVAITQTRDLTTNSVNGTLGNNSSTNAIVGQSFKLDKTLNRGDEVISEWRVLKYDPNSGANPITAVLNVDYQLVSGTNTSDIIEIKFLNNTFNYKVQNYCSGHTFAINPYWTYPADTGENNNFITHDFIVTAATATFEVLFPQLDMVITIDPIENQTSTDPLTTYQNQPITVEAVVLGSTGYWKKKVTSLPDELISKSDVEWKTALTERCNVILEIKDKVTGAVLQTKTGFGPYNVVLQNINNYVFQYKTTLK